ncbi:MAG: YkgJ family cysteine cluster protein [Spirochaetaceae bacterium]|jgi:Fe-S-cluster containining protein|nr:YkgJ family cysteine cluster protein [Spirochaetaceae bacterium]
MVSMPKSPFYAKGLRFSCSRCSSCCRHEPGYVFLSREDLHTLSRALNLSAASFTDAYCRWVPAEGGMYRLSLREKRSFDCVLWEEGGCSVYGARPLQCRSFPFWPANLASAAAWESERSRCPGVGAGAPHPRAEIEAYLAAQRGNPPLTREGDPW